MGLAQLPGTSTGKFDTEQKGHKSNQKNVNSKVWIDPVCRHCYLHLQQARTVGLSELLGTTTDKSVVKGRKENKAGFSRQALLSRPIMGHNSGTFSAVGLHYRQVCDVNNPTYIPAYNSTQQWHFLQLMGAITGKSGAIVCPLETGLRFVHRHSYASLICILMTCGGEQGQQEAVGLRRQTNKADTALILSSSSCRTLWSKR